MVVGGAFTHAGGLPATYIAQCDGLNWSALGGGMSGPVTSLAVFDEDGNGPAAPKLFAAGPFWFAGGQWAQGIARWDGSSWSSIGDLNPLASNSRIVMCAVDEDGPGPLPPALFVGSSALNSGLTSAGGVPVQGLARWNGTSWSAVSGLTAGLQISALGTVDGPAGHPELVAAGYVLGSGIDITSSVARWTGSSWVVLGGYVPGVVRDLASFDTDGAGPNPPEIFIGGNPNVATVFPQLLPLARLTSGSWAAIPIPCSLLGYGCTADPFVNDLLVFDEDGAGPATAKLLAAGQSNGSPGGGFVISTTNGTTLTPVAGNSAAGAGLFEASGNGSGVRAIASFEPVPGSSTPQLFAGGAFVAAEVSCWNFAVWNGSHWSSPGNGLGAQVTAMIEFDPDGAGPKAAGLVAGGRFTIDAGSSLARGVAFWDGYAWSAFGAGLDGPPTAFCVFDEDGPGPLAEALFAGGKFVNGVVTTNVARWDGTSWSYSLNAPTSGSTCAAFATFDDDGPGPNPVRLHAAIADNVQFSSGSVFRLDGGTWLQLGAAPGPVWALSVTDDDGAGPQSPHLCAGGAFSTIAGVPVTNAARWDGQAWSAMGASPGVRGFATFDRDGPGAQAARLHAVGGGVVSYWDGVTWVSAGAASADLRAIGVHDPDGAGPLPVALYVGGACASIDGVAVNSIASWEPGAGWAALGSGIPPPPVSGGVFAIASSHQRGFPALFAGGTFLQAGGANSSHIAGWVIEAGLALSFTNGGGGLVVRNDSCRPGTSYFSAFSLDPVNASQPGAGWWAGLFIDFATVLYQYSVGAPPFLGILDASGASVFPIDPGIQASLSGVTVFAVTRTFDPVLLLPFDASGVASHQF
jgi:hypothetical protein